MEEFLKNLGFSSLAIIILLILSYFFRHLFENFMKQIVDEGVEDLKAKNAEKLESLKDALERAQFAHNIAFEKEFEIYQKLWANTYLLRLSINKLILPAGENLSNLQARYEAALKSLKDDVEEKRPFFAVNVYQALEELMKSTEELKKFEQAHQKKMDEQDISFRIPHHDSVRNLFHILLKTEEIQEAIRKRVTGASASINITDPFGEV